MSRKRWFTASEYSKRVGVSISRLNLLMAKGKLDFEVIDGLRKIDSKKNDPRFMPNKFHDAVSQENQGPLQAEWTLQEAEQQKKIYEAKIKELQYKEKKGELIKISIAERKIFEIVRTTRDAILSIPTRVGPELAAETDPFKVETLLTEEIKQALERLVIVLKRPTISDEKEEIEEIDEETIENIE